jgi:hypothetical protein
VQEQKEFCSVGYRKKANIRKLFMWAVHLYAVRSGIDKEILPIVCQWISSQGAYLVKNSWLIRVNNDV